MVETRRIKRNGLLLLAAMLSTTISFAAAPAQQQRTALKSDAREAKRLNFLAAAKARRELAFKVAAMNGYPVRGKNGDANTFSLIGTGAAGPTYYEELTQNLVISAGGNLIRNRSPYTIDGAGATVALWDEGAARTSHQSLSPRVTIGDDCGSFSNHSTAVAGLIGASGTYNPFYEGMAPGVKIISNSYSDDAAEMMALGAAFNGDQGKVTLSNHSYGVISGWTYGNYSGNTGYHFFGAWDEANPPKESSYFGQYQQVTADWDDIVYNLAYYLPVVAAGNDRDDTSPPDGTPFFHGASTETQFEWVTENAYTSIVDPPGDGAADGGFDTIQPLAAAKNVLTVGAVSDAVANGARMIEAANMTSFSGWGPTDDGRIKPDLVANGETVLMIAAVNDAYYSANPASGTSFSAPSVTGAGALIQQLYARLNGGSDMANSSLKGVLIHTADDLTAGAAKPGPDYSTGWGLLNVKAAADLLLQDTSNSPTVSPAIPPVRAIIEDVIFQDTTDVVYTFAWNRVDPIRVTLCWMDAPGTPKTELDNRTADLVNDIDLRVIGPGGNPVYMPFVLDPNNPSAAATTGDNRIDNVEQILIQNPTPGPYTIRITHKGSLTWGSQWYSIIMSGMVGDGYTEVSAVNDWESFQ